MGMLEVGLAHNDSRNGHLPSGLSRASEACRNLHPDDDGLRPLSIELEKMITRLSVIPRPVALFSSLDNTLPTHQPERRSPSRARRRAWQRKALYQRRRCVERLRPWQIEALFEADHFARAIGLPLNAFLTISWHNTLQGAHDIPKRFARATKAMGEWYRRHHCKPAWIFTHENPGNCRPNVHMLIHVPVKLSDAFEAIAPQWFEALEGGIDIRGRNGPRDRCLSYMIKGTDWTTARRYGAHALKQGTIAFKRCGWTENLGATARKRHSGLKPGLATGFR